MATLPRFKVLGFTAVSILFILLLLEYICAWEEKLSWDTRPSVLEYQQLPHSIFKQQKLLGGGTTGRMIGVSACSQIYALEKPAGQIRIGILGGSAVVGMGYSPSWSFPGILQRLCNAAGVNAEVYNLGRIGFSSRQLIVVADRAIQKLDLDHLIVFAGNNEFLEVNARLTAGENLSGYTAKTQNILGKSALYRTLHKTIFSSTRFRAQTDLVAQSSLPLPEGAHQGVLNEFTNNLSDIIQISKDKCRVTLCTIPVNLLFGPTGKEPFYLEPKDGKKWEYLFASLAWRKLGNEEKAKDLWQKAIENAPAIEQNALDMIWSDEQKATKIAGEVIDSLGNKAPKTLSDTDLFVLATATSITGRWSDFLPFEAFHLKSNPGSYAGTYWKGRFELLKGRTSNARSLLSAARNLDNRRIRILSDFNNAIRSISAGNGADLIEMEADFWNYEHFNDYCHFNINGNFKVAQTIYKHLFSMQFPKVGSPIDWFAKRREDFLVPWQWLGVDENFWEIYTQRPGSIGRIDPDILSISSESVKKGIWAANRKLATWAGGNIAQFETMEKAFRAGLGTEYDGQARTALYYLYQLENFKDKAAELNISVTPAPFPGL